MAIIKTECKCYHCKATLKVGDKAEWFKRTAKGFGHMQKTYSLGYVAVCANESDCDRRRGQAHEAKMAVENQQKAQEGINMMREMGAVGVDVMIDHYAKQGIIVV